MLQTGSEIIWELQTDQEVVREAQTAIKEV